MAATIEAQNEISRARLRDKDGELRNMLGQLDAQVKSMAATIAVQDGISQSRLQVMERQLLAEASSRADAPVSRRRFDIKWMLGLAGRPRLERRLRAEQRVRDGWRRISGEYELFDADWYVAQYPDVRAAGTNPLIHYLQIGWQEGRKPCPLFDPQWYLASSPDVAAAGINPLEHYLCFGAREGRDPHPLFDTEWYLDQNADVRAANVNPLGHYLHFGAREGRDPHPLFDTDWYLDQNADVRAANVNPLGHYVRFGEAEGRRPNPLFDPVYYGKQVETYDGSLRARNAKPPQSVPQRKLPIGPLRSRLFAFTSVTLNYVPKARVLAETLKSHNPDIKFCLMVCEPVEPGVLDELTVFDEIQTVDELNLPNLKAWIFSHTLVELCTAVKGFYMQELLLRPDCAATFYFDPDIVVLDRIDPLLRGLDQASILLTPHLTDPDQAVEAILDNELSALKHGVYNLGFLGVKPSLEGLRFAQWWRDRLERFCRVDIPNGMFTDQRWVDLAPAFFSDIHILRHPGCNVATWNFSNRRIEGSVSSGFRVNGEPLIFYHFSGFDSGAQEAMLKKYGEGMPAAHELRAWYIARSERPEDESFSRRKFHYGTYDNGQPITREQRILYRDREDLQRAFPDPFSTESPAASFLHWYREDQGFGDRDWASIDQGQTSKCLVAHYMVIGATRGLRPSPMFDSQYYLEEYPDVAATGENPLVHYRMHGVREGRKPAAEFDIGQYLEQCTPEERATIADPLQHYYEVGRERGLRVNVLYDPALDSRARDLLLRACVNARPTMLMVMHYGGGGTEKHVHELLKVCDGKLNVLLLNPNNDESIKITCTEFRVYLRFGLPGQWDLLLGLLRDCRVSRVHIHHLFGNEHYLRRLIEALNVPFDYTLHDYYALSPQPHLVGPDGRFVGEDLEAAEEKLLTSGIVRTRPASLRQWRRETSWLLADAARVVAPTNDITRRYQAYFKSLATVVAAHPEAGKAPLMSRSDFSAGQRMRIVCLGVMTEHKGLEVLATCARLARALGDPLEFYLVGDAATENGGRKLRKSGVEVLGTYADDRELFKRLCAVSPHLLWYPVQCPESFCYTLSEGMSTNLPLVVPDLGSFPERVGGRPWTWVRPWDLEPEEWLAFFLSIRDRNFAVNVPPEVFGTPWSVTDDFYRTGYLNWISEASLHPNRRATTNQGKTGCGRGLEECSHPVIYRITAREESSRP
jgi:glycosyltransferase involved in cell wall biosynthesis